MGTQTLFPRRKTKNKLRLYQNIFYLSLFYQCNKQSGVGGGEYESAPPHKKTPCI